MNEEKENVITVDDFNVICRVCLRLDDDMVDIFGSGMDNQIMEITNLKVTSDDKLPKTVCQTCKLEMEHLLKFFQQVKSSDTYLRSLLDRQPETEINVKKPPSKRLKKPKPNKKLKRDLESDKVYLIVVPNINESDSERDICIRDLNADNTELSNYCKTLVENYFSDATDTQEKKELDDANPLDSLPVKIYTVNLDIFNCDCGESFENVNDLTTHYLSHETPPPGGLDSIFKCPVCDRTEGGKDDFLNHLRSHKGASFVRIDSAGAKVPLKELEDRRVFRLNLDDLYCTVCSGYVRRKDSISDHFNECSEKSTNEYFIRYSCPVCGEVFVDEEEDFLRHLGSHRSDNVHYVSVNNKGRPVDGDELFLPLEIAKVLNEGNIVEMVEVNSCDRCEFEAESYASLCEHCNSVHSEEVKGEISLVCPVCCEKCEGGVDEKRFKLYEHLRVHKGEGVSFVRVRRNGTLAEVCRDFSDVFTQSSVLLNPNEHGSSFGTEIFTPELCLSRTENYTCDLCEKEFRSKEEVVKHSECHQTSRERSNFICEKCGKKCAGKASYKKHFLKHSKGLKVGKRPTCSACGKTFANRATLNGHFNQHLKEGTGSEFVAAVLGIMCEKCGKSFSNNASLTKHKKLHSRDKENAALKCEICDRDFFRQSSFDRHKSAHLNPKYFECDVCKLPLSSVVSLQKHSQLHRNGSNTFDCKGCKISFLTKDSLTAHQVHTGHYLDRKPLECNVCHEKFYIGRKFTEHIKTHPKYKMGECTLCGKRLSTIQSLMLHMGRHFESNSILCPHCGKQFFEERNYHRHLLTHEGIKPFPCDVDGCQKSFYTLFELNRHKKYHNNTRDFRCPYCSKSFHEANHLTVHVRTHTGERPYACPHCNKGFVTRTRCKHHIKLVHQGVGYDLIRSSISKKVAVFEAIETTV